MTVTAGTRLELGTTARSGREQGHTRAILSMAEGAEAALYDAGAHGVKNIRGVGGRHGAEPRSTELRKDVNTGSCKILATSLAADFANLTISIQRSIAWQMRWMDRCEMDGWSGNGVVETPYRKCWTGWECYSRRCRQYKEPRYPSIMGEGTTNTCVPQYPCNHLSQLG